MFNFKRLGKSFVYAFRGLFKIFREEQNLRIQTVFGIAALAVAALLSISILEWSLIIISIAMVLLMEVINSAIERAVDILKPRINNYVKEIKDIMAAAVMLASLSAVVIGLLILAPKIFKLFV